MLNGYAIAAPVNNGTLTVKPATLTLTGSKTYDSTTIFAASDVSGGTIATGIDGQTLTLTGSGSVGSANVNAGTQTLMLGSLTLANGTGLASNYQIAATGNTGTITPATLTVTGTKIYNATTGFTASQLAVTGGVSGETVTLVSGTGTTSSANAGTHGGSSLSGLAINVTGGNALASNYQLPVTGVLTITPEAITITAVSNTKTHDGTTSAANPPQVTSGTLYGIDEASLRESYATANAGTGLTLTPGVSFGTAGAAGNYVVTTINATGAINPAILTYVANPSIGTPGVPFPPLTGSVTGFVDGQTLASATTGTLLFSSAATAASPVGIYPVDGSGLTANNGNYLFVQATGNATALILEQPPAYPASQFIASINGTTTTDVTITFDSQTPNIGTSNLVRIAFTPNTRSTTASNTNGASPGAALRRNQGLDFQPISQYDAKHERRRGNRSFHMR
jgi:hypothetical protein